MTTLYGEGESIAAEKIYYCFGSENLAQRGGGRISGTLGKSGYAEVVPGGQASTTGNPDPPPMLRCRSAVAEADKVKKKHEKVHEGSHRSFAGRLIGTAVVTIQQPDRDQLNR